MKRFFILTSVVLILQGCSSQHSAKLEPSDDSTEALQIVTREMWGWQPLDSTIAEHKIGKITLHHGGVDFDPAKKTAVEYIRDLQIWSRSERPWIDIPYHFMIDLEGKIYEARPLQYPGDTNTAYDPRGHALICVIGNYENQIISEQQLESVAGLMALLAKKYNVPVQEIRGHKDYAETDCPGKDLYRYLTNGEIHRRVQAKLEE